MCSFLVLANYISLYGRINWCRTAREYIVYLHSYVNYSSSKEIPLL